MPVYLPSLGLRNYRGIGPDWVMMSDFKEFNFFVGANNAGKSTVLNFISKWLPIRDDRHAQSLTPTEVYLYGSKGRPEMVLGCQKEIVIKKTMERIELGHQEHYRESVEKIVNAIECQGNVWIKHSVPGDGKQELHLHQGIGSGGLCRR
jgi:recombinational DNA repair ATPase RecF